MNPLPLRVFGVGLRDELRGVVREPTALFFGVVMPVGIFVLFNLLHGSQASQGRSAGTAVVATFGAHGVITVASLLGALHAWPLAALSGLWMPVELLPDAVDRLARFLPTHHLAQLGLAQLGAGTSGVHLLALLVTGAVAAPWSGRSRSRCARPPPPCAESRRTPTVPRAASGPRSGRWRCSAPWSPRSTRARACCSSTPRRPVAPRCPGT